MKFSFFHLMPYTGLDEAPGDWPVPNRVFDAEKARDYYRTYIDTMIYAEQCGFDWVGCNEHHFSPYGLMANCNEYIAYNIPPDESWERQREGIALTLRAWTEPAPFGWEGKHFQFRQISIWPKPPQKPHPPLVISASSLESARFAGEMKATMGMVLIFDLAMAKECISVYRDAARASGWEPGPENILIGMHTCIADTDEDAKTFLREGKTYFDQILMGGPRTAGKLVLRKTRYYQDEANSKRMGERLAKREAATLEQQIAGGMVFCGSPQSVAQVRDL